MSKASKLTRMRNTVLETTGLRYNTSGETVELNFFPNSTDTGVSVPLVLKGNIGPSTATNTPPLLGYPFAHIVDSQPYITNGGDFRDTTDNSSSYGGFQLPGGDNSTTQHYRSRTFQTLIVDEIGVSMVEAPDTGNDDGGPGTFLNFPVGKYYLSGSAPAFRVNLNTTYWCNYTKAKPESVANRETYIKNPLGIRGKQNFTSTSGGDQIRSIIKGRFTVSSADDSYLLLHGCQLTSSGDTGMGFSGSDGSDYKTPIGVIFSELKIWKIG